MTTSRILLLTGYPLWADALRAALAAYSPAIDVEGLITDGVLSAELVQALASEPGVVLVSLEPPFVGLDAVRTLRDVGYSGGIMVICSHFSLPTLEQLGGTGVQAIISSLATVEELVASIYALMEGHPEPLLQQHLRAARRLNQARPVPRTLNEREREILQLVAGDLTDQEIADHMQISARTVSNHLHRIYAKLGVKGRAGAVTAGLARRLIRLYP